MKCVLASIKPRWWEKIAIHRKTDEIRKNAPNLQPPFKCYIYQTQEMWGFPILRALRLFDLVEKFEMGKGKVIGEFVCDKIEQVDAGNISRIERSSLVSTEEMWKYAKPKSMFDLKAWHISDLKIYDKPKPLRRFHKPCPYKLPDGTRMDVPCPCDKYTHEFDEETGLICCTRRMKKPPQSWCYVEELQDG